MTKIPVRHINKPDSSEGLIIRKVETLTSEKTLAHGLHRHDFFFVLALEKGKGEHVIDFTSYAIRDRSIFFLRPGQVHQLTLMKGSTGYLLEFSGDYLSRKVTSRSNYALSAKTFEKFNSILSYVLEEYSERKPNYREVIKANLEIFFIELSRQNQNPKSHLTNSKSYSQERLDDLLELLETNISKKKQVTEYASMLNLTPYQVNAITKETLGKTCSELINEQIVLEAKRYLLATSEQINQIASHLGYEDISYFIRFFKKHTGYSPQAFRESFK